MSRLPAALRAMNAVGAALPLTRLLSLDPSALEAKARRATGLEDFGDPKFQEGLERLVESLEREACLSALGRVIARRDCLRLLENRLRMQDVWRRHPEIGEGRIERPIFILGLPRTGTTILHELLAQDPANRVPLTWEVMFPWPPPERARYASDPRIAQVEGHFSGVDRVLPGFQSMHAMGALLPQECVAITAHDFASMIFHSTHRVPSYEAWLESLDMRPIYASHRRQLQYLQWRCPGERWVLKSPAHLWSLEALLDVYPDARLVHTHRDPLEVVASLTSLIALLRSMGSDRVDPGEIGEDWSARLARGLSAAAEARDRLPIPDARIFDLHFRDFMRDEIAAVRRMYEHFGTPLGAEAESRMRSYLARNPADRHGRHRYRLADAGLEPERERERFRAYQERFGVESEAVA